MGPVRTKSTKASGKGMTTAQAAAFPAITKPSAQLNIAKATRAPQITQDSVGGLLYNGEPALYHHLIRQELIDDAKVPGESYDHERGHGGLAADDVTSYLPSQKTWGIKHPHYAPIVFQYEQKDHESPDYTVEDWKFKGKVVLNMEGNPMRFFHDIPATIASHITGAEIEAIQRTDKRIKDKDFWDRQPHRILTGMDNQGNEVYENRKKLVCFSSRASKFRKHSGCIVWVRNRTQAQRNLKACMDQRMTTKAWQDNSIETLGDLTTEERKFVKKACGKNEDEHTAASNEETTSSPNEEAENYVENDAEDGAAKGGVDEEDMATATVDSHS